LIFAFSQFSEVNFKYIVLIKKTWKKKKLRKK
jgi:hypothetical protein